MTPFADILNPNPSGKLPRRPSANLSDIDRERMSSLGRELESQIAESRHRALSQRQQNLTEELDTILAQFSVKGGGGAPLHDETGSTISRHATVFTNDSIEKQRLDLAHSVNAEERMEKYRSELLHQISDNKQQHDAINTIDRTIEVGTLFIPESDRQGELHRDVRLGNIEKKLIGIINNDNLTNDNIFSKLGAPREMIEHTPSPERIAQVYKELSLIYQKLRTDKI